MGSPSLIRLPGPYLRYRVGDRLVIPPEV